MLSFRNHNLHSFKYARKASCAKEREMERRERAIKVAVVLTYLLPFGRVFLPAAPPHHYHHQIFRWCMQRFNILGREKQTVLFSGLVCWRWLFWERTQSIQIVLTKMIYFFWLHFFRHDCTVHKINYMTVNSAASSFSIYILGIHSKKWHIIWSFKEVN